MEAGAELVADDRTVLEARDGVLVAFPPPGLAGMIEVRGVGILRVPHRSEAPVALSADLVSSEAVPRLPEPRTESIEGITVPRCTVAAFENSAPAKLRLAMRHGVGSAP